jgi:thiamine-monophosphate kinase
MLDLSDGLAQDAGHLARASGVCVTLDAARLPPFGRFEPLARSLGLDPVTLALVGGEDYELLAAAPRDAFGPAWTVVGTVLQGSGVDVPGGPKGPLRGWDHG